jgi:hypothetical protein
VRFVVPMALLPSAHFLPWFCAFTAQEWLAASGRGAKSELLAKFERERERERRAKS